MKARVPVSSLFTSQRPQTFKVSNLLVALKGLPRVLRLAWKAHSLLTIGFAVLTLLSGVTPVAQVIIPGLLLDAVLQAIAQHTIVPLLFPLFLQLGVTLLDRIVTVLTNIAQGLLQDRVTNYIQSLLLEKAISLDLQFFEQSEFYDTLRRANDGTMSRPVTMVQQSFSLIKSLITLISTLVLLIPLAWWLLPIAVLLPIPSFIALSRYSMQGYWMLRNQSSDKRTQTYLQYILTNSEYTKEIKLYNLGFYFLGQFRNRAQKLYVESKKLLVSRNVANFSWSLLPALANVAVYLYIALQAINGRISPGGITRYTLAMNQASQQFQSVLDSVSGAYENTLYMDLLFEFLRYEPRIVSPSVPQHLSSSSSEKGLDIEFRHVSFTYPNQSKPTLHDVSFVIRGGETVALVGQNGAGKTTLIKLLTRLYDPDEGEILVGGQNIKHYNLEELHESIGVIFQDYVKYNMTARENIGVGHVTDIANQPPIQIAAEKSGADTVITRLRDGYEAMLGHFFQDGVMLSGGEWQKIALARAFLRDSSILVLDEPTSALDPQAEYDIFTRFRRLTEDRTVLFISHRFNTVRLANTILVIEHGSLLEQGSHEALIKKNGRYAHLFRLQAEAYLGRESDPFLV